MATENIGTLDTSVFTVKLYASDDTTIDTSDELIGTCFYPALTVGQSRNRKCDITATASSTAVYVGAIGDSEDVIFELDESNNSAFDTVSYNAAGGDITVSSVVCPDPFSAGASGDCVVTFHNVGANAVVGFDYEIRLSSDNVIDNSDSLLGTCTKSAMAGGAITTDTCTVTMPGGTAAGDHFLGVVADSADAVAESFEDNNTGYDRVTVP